MNPETGSASGPRRNSPELLPPAARKLRSGEASRHDEKRQEDRRQEKDVPGIDHQPPEEVTPGTGSLRGGCRHQGSGVGGQDE